MNRERTSYIGWLLIGYFVSLLLALLVNGCAAMGRAPSSTTHPFTAVDNTLGKIASASGGGVGLSIIAIGLGVMLMLYLKTSLGPAMIAGGAVTLVLSLLVSSIVWFIPWVCGLVLFFGVVAFAVDAEKRGFWNALLDARDVLHLPK